MLDFVKIAVAQGFPNRIVPDCSPTGAADGLPMCDGCQLALMGHNIIQVLIYAAFIILTFMAMTGGIRMFFSAGKPENLQNARKHIMAAVVGLVIVLVSWTLINYIFVTFTNLETADSRWYQLDKLACEPYYNNDCYDQCIKQSYEDCIKEPGGNQNKCKQDCIDVCPLGG